jgi:hypothetical protein
MLTLNGRSIGIVTALTLAVLSGCGGDATSPGSHDPAAVTRHAGLTLAARPGGAVDTVPAVRVTDRAGAPVAGARIVFAVGAGHGTITGATQTTDADGVARVGSWTLGGDIGTDSLSATVASLPAVYFTAAADPCVPLPYAVAETVTGALPAAGCTVAGAPVENYSIRAIAAQQVTIRVRGANYLVDAQLRDATTGALLARSEENGYDSFISILAPTGRYRLSLTPAVSGKTGAYSVTSQDVGFDLRCRNAWVVPGITSEQQITYTDCWDGTGPYYSDNLWVQLEKGQTVTVAMRSASFDPRVQVLGIVDDELVVVASVAGARGGTDVSLAFTAPQTGRYLIRATTAGMGQTGAYTLSVR